MSTQHNTPPSCYYAIKPFKRDGALTKIARMLPSPPYNTGPESTPFTILEDALILINSHQPIGSALTQKFWQQVVNTLHFDRSADALRMRFTTYLSRLEKFDEIIRLLEQKQYDHCLKFQLHDHGVQIEKVFVKLRDTIIPPQCAKVEEQTADQFNAEVTVPRKDSQPITVETYGLRYMSVIDDRELIEVLIREPRHHHLLYDWVEAKIAQVKNIARRIGVELELTRKELLFMDEFGVEQHRLQKELNFKQLNHLQQQQLGQVVCLEDNSDCGAKQEESDIIHKRIKY